MYIFFNLLFSFYFMKRFANTLSITSTIAFALVLAACNGSSGNDVAVNSVPSVPFVPTVLAQSDSFTYETYSPEAFASLKGSEAFSVFVHSNTCGTCAKKNQEIISDVATFTDGTILKMEYSEAPASFLETYGVTTYDTFVNFDESGNATTIKGAAISDVRDTIGDSDPSIINRVLDGILPSVYAQTDTFTYQDFDDATYQSLRGSESFSIFFHSKTCGTCAKKNVEIIDEKNEFTNGTILKLEYDEAPQALLEEFGVTKYDTFVNFDAAGNAQTVKGALVDDVRNSIQ